MTLPVSQECCENETSCQRGTWHGDQHMVWLSFLLQAYIWINSIDNPISLLIIMSLANYTVYSYISTT